MHDRANMYNSLFVVEGVVYPTLLHFGVAENQESLVQHQASSKPAPGTHDELADDESSQQMRHLYSLRAA